MKSVLLPDKRIFIGIGGRERLRKLLPYHFIASLMIMRHHVYAIMHARSYFQVHGVRSEVCNHPGPFG
jgi:hypothetical protein